MPFIGDLLCLLLCQQFIERILLMFHPKKYQKDFEFLKYVKIKRVHIFTGIQILCMVILWTVKSIDHIALAFPFVVRIY